MGSDDERRSAILFGDLSRPMSPSTFSRGSVFKIDLSTAEFATLLISSWGAEETYLRTSIFFFFIQVQPVMIRLSSPLGTDS